MGQIAGKIRTAQDKDGMLRRALERIIQLYTDKSHFVYELLQNAEDAEATSIKFVQYGDRLEVFHDGKPFTSENLQGLCDIGRSDKADNLNQIGEFGVGFKSVFGICDTVDLYSVPAHFREQNRCGDAVPFAVKINDFTRPEDIAEAEIDGRFTTKFVFPYVVGKSFSGFSTIQQLNNTLSKKLQNLGITTLLFMKNLEVIEYQIRINESVIEGSYLLEQKPINDHCKLVSAIGMGSTDGQEEEVSYLKFTRFIDSSTTRSVDVAFPVTVDESGDYTFIESKEPYVSVYFPTETESKLGFVVQGPYRTTPNRSSIPADNEDNIRLAKETAILLRQCILELRDSKKLNMSFVKMLPVSDADFNNFKLFRPLYDVVNTLFSSQKVIPCLKNGEYTTAACAKIARQEKLASLFSDNELSLLIHDGKNYHWLPTLLTETNREYSRVFRFFTDTLKIQQVRPEDLRIYFANNPKYLPTKDNDWLVELYSMLERIAAEFTKNIFGTNMLTSAIVKTSTGIFVAPYRKTENKQYIPNVFIPSTKIDSDSIHFVDEDLYNRCRHFFDNILQLQEPNEYEFMIKDIQKRYGDNQDISDGQHIKDIKYLLKYIKYEDYKDDIIDIINSCFTFKCIDGKKRNAFVSQLYIPITIAGISNEGYFRHINSNIYYVDLDFYSGYGIIEDHLVSLGVKSTLVTGDQTKSGVYPTGGRGANPDWWVTDDFRWKLSLVEVKSVLSYISKHPTAKDSLLKSAAIFRVLILNENKLSGTVHIGGSTPDLLNEPCDLVRILRNETYSTWDGRWLFTKSGELVSQREISKYDLNPDLYGKIRAESEIYNLLGFKKTDLDEVDDLRKTVPKKQLDAFFENELKQRFGITTIDLEEVYGEASDYQFSGGEEDDVSYEFPVARVKNWDSLVKHAAEMFVYAAPTDYQYVVRRIRTTNSPKDIKSYLYSMYRYDGVYKYACQICHEATAQTESAELFNKPDFELDPLNLCLCPNCAAKYRTIRNDESAMELLKSSIIRYSRDEVKNGEQVIIPVSDIELWFTQIHFAEIQELLKLSDEAKADKKAKKPTDISNEEDESEKSGLSVYEDCVGKTIRRKTDGTVGIIERVDIKGEWFFIKVTKSKFPGKVGSTMQIAMSNALSSQYTIE